MIAFVASERREFSGLERHLTGMRRLDLAVDYAATAELRGRPVVLIANGPGPELARQGMARLGNKALNALVSIGFCGALVDRLKPSDIFTADSVNGRPVAAPAAAPPGAHGPLLSVDRVVGTSEEKRALGQSGAEAVEMEAAAVLDCAKGLPFYCIRVVTDTAGESFPIDFNRMRDRAGRFSRSRIAAAACLRPFQRIPGLIRLDRRCKSAATALGDFIADCQF